MAILAIGSADRGDASEFAKWSPLLDALEAGAFCFFFTKTALEVCEIPSRVCVDAQRRLHAEDGPAFAWLGETVRDHYWHGVHVPEHVVTAPEKITVSEIEEQSNAEVRRVMIERYGQDHYLIDSRAEEIGRDDYGVLFRKEIPGDEPLVMVKVVNATMEADGSFREYFIRVPPTMRSARESVAWTFGKEANEYAPVLQT